MRLIFGPIFSLLQLLGKLLFDWWGWVPLVGLLSYLIWQNSRRTRSVIETEHVLLQVEMPQDNQATAVNAEQMFAALHGMLRPRAELMRQGRLQEHIGLELAAVGGHIRFYIWTPKLLRSFVETQVTAQYPDVKLQPVEHDYAARRAGTSYVAGAEFSLTGKDVLPIKTFADSEVDPLAGVTAVLAKLEESGEQAWLQILARPIEDSWHTRGERFIQNLREGRLGVNLNLGRALPFVRNFITALWQPPSIRQPQQVQADITDTQQAQLEAVKDKITKPGFEVKIRFVHIGPKQNLAELRVQSLLGALKQYTTAHNGFRLSQQLGREEALGHYRARLFLKKGFILNIEELASLYHLPGATGPSPQIERTATKASATPINLPLVEQAEPAELSAIGSTNFQGHPAQFGIKRSDRERHLYVIGQTGTGKSFLMELLALSDIHYHHGVAIIDPHGDFATHLLKYIPKKRLNDVIYFNPSDNEFPVAFNPLEVTDPALKGHISSELVGVLKRMFGHSWGPRLEYILRYTILALLDYPHATMLGITRMLTDQTFRKAVIKQIGDPVVKNFWVNEFVSWNDKFAAEAVAPILNKVGAFTANPLIRQIIGQPTNTLNLRAIMDEGKILIVNLSQGRMGEDNAATLGALLVTKLQLAAMSRASLESNERRPFYLYVDEFQNFATDSFATILSEARKYGLNLTLANQYVAQMSEQVRDAVFGNVGNTIVFRVGADDGAYLAKYFEPTFDSQDLIRLHNRHFIIAMSIDGEKVPPFAATSLNLPQPRADYSSDIVALSRSRYGTRRDIIESQIARLASFETPERPLPSQPDINRDVTGVDKPPEFTDNELRPHTPIKLRR